MTHEQYILWLNLFKTAEKLPQPKTFAQCGDKWFSKNRAVKNELLPRDN